MATKTIYLTTPQKNDFLFWTVATQCFNLGTVIIRDDATLYATIRKTSTSTSLQVLEQSTKQYTGTKGLRVEIDIPASDHIKVASEAVQPIEAGGKTVGCCYNFCIEDYIDEDYNDFYINIVSWNKKW
ncbi:MAG: hypothetical protein RR066_03940 [Mucinivorans sp.]